MDRRAPQRNDNRADRSHGQQHDSRVHDEDMCRQTEDGVERRSHSPTLGTSDSPDMLRDKMFE